MQLSNRQKVIEVRAFIADHLDDPMLGKIDTLSSRFLLTSKTLNRLFKAQFGLTVHAFIVEERMNKAVSLLQQGWLIQEVAPLVGYEYVESFSRAFRKRFGYSPQSKKSS